MKTISQPWFWIFVCGLVVVAFFAGRQVEQAAALKDDVGDLKEPPLSSMKVISDTTGLVTAITVSNQSVTTFTYGRDTNGQRMADTNSSSR
jgi:hypothetical protein